MTLINKNKTQFSLSGREACMARQGIMQTVIHLNQHFILYHTRFSSDDVLAHAYTELCYGRIVVVYESTKSEVSKLSLLIYNNTPRRVDTEILYSQNVFSLLIPLSDTFCAHSAASSASSVSFRSA